MQRLIILSKERDHRSRFFSGKRDVSDMDSEDVSRDIDGNDDDYNDGDRDRRAIDEEDDEDFFQELNSLANDVKREYVNLIFRYESLESR